MDWDDLPNSKNSQIVIGENLERLSLEDLRARIAALNEEIVRVEAEMARKEKIGAAAAAVFKD